MSRIRGQDTTPEVLLRKALWDRGYRYRLKSRLPGKPDIIFGSKNIAIFIDGCFWHGCPLHSVKPKTNRKFWTAKLQRNQERDREVTAELNSMGIEVHRFWEHDVLDDIHSVLAIIEGAMKLSNHRGLRKTPFALPKLKRSVQHPPDV